MGRPKKTKINLNKESLQEFMQEIYNDCVNVMNSARKELNERKSRAEIDDINDESLIGKVNNDTLKIIEATIDNDNSSSNTSLSVEDKETLRDLFKEKSDTTNTEYDLD